MMRPEGEVKRIFVPRLVLLKGVARKGTLELGMGRVKGSRSRRALAGVGVAAVARVKRRGQENIGVVR